MGTSKCLLERMHLIYIETTMTVGHNYSFTYFSALQMKRAAITQNPTKLIMT